MGETGFCDTADLRKLGEAGIGVSETEVAGFADLGGERGAALFGKKLLHEVGLADGGVNGFLEICRLAVHLPVHAVPHILHDADALEVHVALGSAHDLKKFGDFIPVFDIDDVVILAVGQAGIQSEALHGFHDLFGEAGRLRHHLEVVVALGTADGAAAQEGTGQVGAAFFGGHELLHILCAGQRGEAHGI